MDALFTMVITMTLTAYTDCDPGMRCDGIMASGITTFDGAAACGPTWPFDTVFFVPSLLRSFTCLDRGSAIDDNHLDLWMADRNRALEFGVQEAMVIFTAGGAEHERGRTDTLEGNNAGVPAHTTTNLTHEHRNDYDTPPNDHSKFRGREPDGSLPPALLRGSRL